MATTPSSGLRDIDPPRAEPWDPADFAAWLADLRKLQTEILASRGGKPFADDELDELLRAVREGRD